MGSAEPYSPYPERKASGESEGISKTFGAIGARKLRNLRRTKMSKLQVKIDGEWKDLEKVEDLSWERTYAKEPLRTVGKIEGTIDTDIDLAELTKPKCFVANDEIEKDHEAHIDMISDTTFAFIEEAYMNLLYKAKAIHCVGENDRIYYEWNYETLERNVPLPHDDRPCYEKGRVTVIYKIIRSDNKAEIFDRNFKKLTSGEFGNPEKFETMVAYWKAQAEAGYPYAEENVRYFEDMVRKESDNAENKG